ncbi:hypothetical protein LTR95_001282 [Oleoguttula sp. CCFEE 5521]
MSNSTQWTYDERLKDYCYFDVQRNEYVTKGGRRYRVNASGGGSTAPRDFQQKPRTTLSPTSGHEYVPGSPQQGPSSLASVAGTGLDNRVTGFNPVRDISTGLSPSQEYTVRPSDEAVEARRHAVLLSIAPRNYAENHHLAPQVASQPGRAPSQTSEASGPPQQVVKVLRGTPGERELLHPAYKKRDQPRKFFVFGKVCPWREQLLQRLANFDQVFLTLWVEPMGETQPGRGSVATYREVYYGKFGEPVYSDIRRFVVVREGEQSCTALSIRTYSGKGAVQRRDQAENGMVYTSRQPPRRPPLEPRLLPDAIRVDLDDQSDKLAPLSRINYGTVYTIEHNVKVKPYAMVNREHRASLLSQFREVFVARIGVHASRPSGAALQAQLPLSQNMDQRTHTPADAADIARHIAAARFVEAQRRRPDRQDRPSTAGSRVSEAIYDDDDGNDDDGNQSDGSGQQSPEDSHADEDGRDTTAGRHRELARLTGDERQRMLDSFARVRSALVKKGYSSTEAAREAKKVMTTEIAKLLSNARDRSQATDARTSQDLQSSAGPLTGGVSAKGAHPREFAGQSRRPSMPLSSQRPIAVAVEGSMDAMAHLSLGISNARTRSNRRSESSDRQNRSRSEQRPSKITYRTELPPTQQRPDPTTSSDPILSAETLTQRGWEATEIILYRRLIADDWKPPSAQAIIGLARRGLAISAAKEIASVMEDGYSLEEAIARIRGPSDAASMSTKGKERAR